MYVTNEKIGAISNRWYKLQYTLTDNGFRQVKIAYLAVISNLDKLVQPSYTLSMQIRTLACVGKA